MARIFSATFTPYTYEQYATPVREATAYHQKIQDQYDAALLEAYKLNSMLDQQNDPESWKLYNDTVKTVYDMANYLNTKGLDANAQANLMKVRMQSQNIFDINAAINRKQEAIKSFMNSANGQNPRYIGIRPEETSVDDWRGGKTPDLFGVNGEQVSQYIENATKNVTSQLFNEYNSRGYRITEIGVNPIYRQQVFNALTDENYDGNYQFTKDAVQNQYMNNVVRELRQTMQNAQFSFGFDQLKSDENKQRFASEMFNGIQNGIQYSKKSEVDQYALDSFKTQNDIYAAIYKDAATNPKSPNMIVNGKVVPRPQQEDPMSATFGQHFNYLDRSGEYTNLKTQFSTLGGINIDTGQIQGGVVWDNKGQLKEQFKNPVVLNKDKKSVHPKDNNFFIAYEQYIKPLNSYIESLEINDITGEGYRSVKPSLYQNYSDEELMSLYNMYKEMGYTKETYDALKKFNVSNLNDYNEGKGFNAQDALNEANKLVQKSYVTSFTLTDNSQAGDIIMRGLNTSERQVREIDYSGKRGDLLKNRNVPFLKKEGKNYVFDKDVVTGYGYDIDHPDEFIIYSGNKGYAVPINIFPNEVQTVIKASAVEYQTRGNNGIRNQDASARFLYDFFLEGASPVHGNTINRE